MEQLAGQGGGKAASMSSYAKARKEMARSRDGDGLACRSCNGAAAWAVLSDHGGLCYPCFRAYCREATPPRVDVGDKRQGPLEWAIALERRHQAWETLTPAQVSAYRAALRQRKPETVEAE